MSQALSTGRARIVRALELAELCIHYNYPVDSSNSNLIPLSSLSKLPRLKERKGSELVYRNRYVNYQYRFLYEVLVNWQSQCSSRSLYFVTVTFDQKTHERYLSKDNPSNEFGSSLRRKLKTKGFSGRYFFVLEKERKVGSKLHMHMLCVCNETDSNLLREVLNSYADSTQTAVRFQQEFILSHSASKYVTVMIDGKPTEVVSAEWGQLEDDPDTPYKLNSAGDKWQAKIPVNVGAADYMSKHDQVWRRETGSRCMWAPAGLIQEANKLHESHKEREREL